MTQPSQPPKSAKPDPAPRSKPSAPSDQPPIKLETAKTEKKPSVNKVGGRIEIPLISTPNDQVELEREMEELFNEEKVKHHHGGSEPERD